MSRCVLTETYSPPAIENAPATIAAIPAVAIASTLFWGGCGDTDHDARRRHDAVVRAEHPGAKPVQTLADVLEVSFTGMLRVR